MDVQRFTSRLFTALLLITLAIGLTKGAGAFHECPYPPGAKDYPLDGYKSSREKAKTAVSAQSEGAAIWEKAAAEFAGTAYWIHERRWREGEVDSIRIFVHLGRGNALLQQGKAMSPGAAGRAGLLDQAASELGCSLVESPSLAAVLLLAETYQLQGTEEARRSLLGLRSGGAFTFPDASWACERAYQRPGKTRKVKLRGPKDVEIALTVTYDTGGPVSVSLGIPLPRTIQGVDAAKADLGDLEALGENSKKDEATKAFVARWARIFENPPPLLDLRASDTKDVISITAQLKETGISVTSWKLVVPGKEPVKGVGALPSPLYRWDTLDEQGSVNDGIYILQFELIHAVNGKEIKNTWDLPVNVQNPPATVRLDHRLDDRKHVITLYSPRPLFGPVCAVRLVRNGEADNVEKRDVPLALVEPRKSLSTQGPMTDPSFLWRYRYEGVHSIDPMFAGSVAIAGDQPRITFGDKLITDFGKLPAVKTINPGVGIRILVTDSVRRAGVGIRPRYTVISTENDPRGLEVTVLLEGQLQEKRLEPDGPWVPVSGHFECQYRFPPLTTRDPSGVAVLRAKVNGKRVDGDYEVLVRTHSPKLEKPIYTPSTVPVGSTATLVLRFSVPLAREPICILDDAQGWRSERYCRQIDDRTYTREFTPVTTHPLNVEVNEARDDLGNTADVAELQGFQIIVQPKRPRLTLDLPDILPLGRSAVNVFVNGYVDVPAKIQVETEDGTQLPVQKRMGGDGPDYIAEYTVTASSPAEITFVASDPEGKFERAKIKVPVDKVPPTFNFISTPGLVTKPGPVWVTFRASELLRPDRDPEAEIVQGSNPPRKAFKLIPDQERPGEWRAQIDIRLIAGSGLVRITGYDLAGNRGESTMAFEVNPTVGRNLQVETGGRFGRWGVGDNPITVTAVGGDQNTPPILVVNADNREHEVKLQGGNGRFTGIYHVDAVENALPYRAVLKLDGAPGSELIIDPDQPRPEMNVRLEAGGEKGRIHVVVADRLRPLRSVTVLDKGRNLRVDMVQVIRETERGEWHGEIESLGGEYKFSVTAEDLLGRTGAGKDVEFAPVLAPRRAGTWQLIASTNLTGRDQDVTFIAIGPEGTDQPDVRAVIVGEGIKEVDENKKVNREGADLVFQNASAAGRIYRGIWRVRGHLKNGDVEARLLVNKVEQPFAKTQITLKTEEPLLVIEPTPIAPNADKTTVVVRTDNGDAIRDVRIEVIDPVTKKPLQVFTRGVTTDNSLSREHRVELPIPASVRAMAMPRYTLRVSARDAAGNVVVTGGDFSLAPDLGEFKNAVIKLLVPADGPFTSLPQVVYGVDGPDKDKYTVRLSVRIPNGATPIPLPGQPLQANEARIIEAQNRSVLPPGRRKEVTQSQPASTLVPPGYAVSRLERALGAARVGTYELIAELFTLDGRPGPAAATITHRIECVSPNVDPKVRHAILVGVKDYDPKKAAPLKMSFEDVWKLWKTLTTHGYLPENITVILDTPDQRFPNAKIAAVKADTLRLAIKEAVGRARAAQAEYLVFAYNGHGANTGGEEARDILLPAQFEWGISSDFVRVGELLETFTHGGAENWEIPNVLVLLDACRNGVEDTRFKMKLPALPAISGERTVALLTASRPGEESLELGARVENVPFLNFQGGLFTEKLTQQIEKGLFGNWEDFYNYLKDDVATASKELKKQNYVQQPVYQSYPQQQAATKLWEFFDRKNMPPASAAVRASAGPRRLAGK